MTETEERFITARQVAKILGVSRQWVYIAARRGSLPSYKFGRVLRFRRSEIEQWVQQRARGTEEA